MKPIALLAILATSFTTLPDEAAHAADTGGGWYVSPLVQWWDLDSARRAASHVAGEVALGYAYDETWAVEVEGAGASSASYCGCVLTLAAASLDGVYKFGTGAGLKPFLIAGLGIMHDVVDRSPTSTGPTVEAGAGLLGAFGHANLPVWQWRGEIKYRREFRDRTAIRSNVGDLVAGLGLQYNFR